MLHTFYTNNAINSLFPNYVSFEIVFSLNKVYDNWLNND